jgi:hypothetical protein
MAKVPYYAAKLGAVRREMLSLLECSAKLTVRVCVNPHFSVEAVQSFHSFLSL